MSRNRITSAFVFGCALFALCGNSALAAGGTTTQVVPAGVRIAGVRVGGLDVSGATSAVKAAFAKPLAVEIAGSEVNLSPAKLATAYIANAVEHARSATAGTNVPLAVSVHGTAVRTAVAAIAKRTDTRAKLAQLSLKNGKPLVVSEVNGTRVDQGALTLKIVKSLTGNVRLAVRAPVKAVKPAAQGAAQVDTRSIILVNREKNRLYLFYGNKLVRTFEVATGQSIYPTPSGRFQIIVKWVNPTWYPPTQDAWAKGLKPVPPGPDNPLGTRWMGLSSPGIGIHGTDEPTSIGYSESHGCIRMHIADSEWLFDHLQVGTTVFIV